MFNNVIVGVDPRRGGQDAVALAKQLMSEAGQLTLATVDVSAVAPGRRWGGRFKAAERTQSMDLLEQVRADAQLEAQLCCKESSTIGRGLHELAESLDADLLVVGSTGYGLFGRVLLGDDTRAALGGAPCAVAIAPQGYSKRPTALSEIGVGYDGSAESEYALAVARELAAEHGAQVSAFEAVSLPAYLLMATTGSSGSAIEESIDQFVQDARDRIRALGDVTPHAAYGRAAEELALYGAAVDLLIVGSRGYGPLGRLVHGSVSQELAHSAHCPLLVLTRGARERSDHLVGHAAITSA
jgi:nucleotide-binding universal stress UspA family protein